jgi:hypothetical protein
MLRFPRGVAYNVAAHGMADRIATVSARRIRIPAGFGAGCAVLCSQNAGFIVCQSLLMTVRQSAFF